MPNRQRRTRTGRRNPNNAVQRLSRQLAGGRRNPSADPKGFTQVPWNTCTVSIQVNGKQEIIINGAFICKALQVQLALPDTIALSVRLQSVEVWERTGESGVTLSVVDFAVAFAANDYLFQGEDLPGLNHWARIGYTLPRDQQRFIFNNTDTENVIWVEGENTNVKFSLRFRVLWKTRTVDPPTVSRARSSSSASSYNEVSGFEARLDELTEKLRILELRDAAK